MPPDQPMPPVRVSPYTVPPSSSITIRTRPTEFAYIPGPTVDGVAAAALRMGDVPNKPKTPARTVRLSDELWAELQAEAAALPDASVSDLIRQAIEDRRKGGAWLVYCAEDDDVQVHATEIDALRAALAIGWSVVFVPWGGSLDAADFEKSREQA